MTQPLQIPPRSCCNRGVVRLGGQLVYCLVCEERERAKRKNRFKRRGFWSKQKGVAV